MFKQFSHFRAKLSTQGIFDDWAAKVQARNLGVSGRIMAIEQTRRQINEKPKLRLRVNFHVDIITLAKEVSFLFFSESEFPKMYWNWSVICFLF